MRVKGFTLIETVIVMLLILILATGVYLIWPTRSVNIGAVAHQIMADMSYAQYLAYATERPNRFYFNPEVGEYGISSPDGLTEIKNPTTNTATVSLPAGMTVTLTGFGRDNDIVFDTHGNPYLGGSMAPLTQNAFIQLFYHGKRAVITVSRYTGVTTGPIVTGG